MSKADDGQTVTLALIMLAIAIRGKFRSVLSLAFQPTNRTFTLTCLLILILGMLFVLVVYPKLAAYLSALSAPAAATSFATPAAPVAAAVIASTACVDGETEVLTAERKKVKIRSLKAGDLILCLRKRKLVVVPIVKVTENEVLWSH